MEPVFSLLQEASSRASSHGQTDPPALTEIRAEIQKIAEQLLALCKRLPAPVAVSLSPPRPEGYNPDMAYPPEGLQFAPNMGGPKPLDGLMKNINVWTKAHGYTVVTGSSHNKPQRRRRVKVRCACNGEARYRIPNPSEDDIRAAREAGQRKPYKRRHSRKTGCMFCFNLVETAYESGIFEVRDRQEGKIDHNHGPE